MHKAHTLPAMALLATCLYGLAGPAAAQTAPDPADAAAPEEPEIPRYGVEIILFRYGAGVPVGNEVFLPDPPPAAETLPPPFPVDGSGDLAAVPTFGDLPTMPADAAPPGADGTPPATVIDADSLELEEIVLPTNRVALEVLPREALTLTAIHEKLELLDAYEPVLWAGWTQAAVDAELSPAIPLRRLGNAPPEFDGTLKLYLSRFLHLVVDLTLTPREERGYDPPAPRYGDPRGSADRFEFGPFGEPQRGAVRLRIEEDRIVKNGDLRYFDHPRFGLLARVTRIEATEAIPAETDDTDFLAPAPVER